MSHKFIIIATMFVSSLSMNAGDKALPTAQTAAGMPVMEALSQRRSVREYATEPLTDQELANVLWAAIGQNRADGHLTAPSCRNYQEIIVYVFDKDGVSEYVPQTHTLKPLATGDHRNLVAGPQDFVVDAPVSLVIVADMSKFGEINDRAMLMAAVDAGIVSQNISVACAGLGLATVPRATMQSDEIVALLELPDTYKPLMNNPVGHEAK